MKTRIRGSILFLAITLQSPVVVEAQHFPSNEDLTTTIRSLVEEGPATAIVFGVLEADGSTRVVSYGDAGSDARPLGPRSVFEIGSISKVFTATLLAEMVARGEVSLSDPVSKYLPKEITVPSREGREITLLDLATHQSGLPRNPDNMSSADPKNKYADYSAEKLYTFLSSHELRREPGSEMEYSNLGMGLLSHALARAGGGSFKDLVRERILDPLGMNMTGYALEGEMAEWMAEGYDKDGNVATFWDVDVLAGAGGLRSNVEDMLVFVAANMGSQNTQLERAMRDTHEIRKRRNAQYGIGLSWQVRSDKDGQILLHSGGTGGYHTEIAFDPDKGVGYVLLTNSAGFDNDFGLDLLRGKVPPVQRTKVEVAAEILETYVGEYEFAPGFTIVVSLEDGTLFAQPTGQEKAPLFAESETKYFLKVVDAQITFTKDDSGAVTEMILHQNGRSMPGRKKEK